jgi:N-acetylmuramoyl-L-alanine amidase
LLTLGFLLLLTACGARVAGVVDGGGDPAGGDVARARSLVLPAGVLPGRAEAIALAESIEARATDEGAGRRAVELHAVAARLLERVWRVYGRDQDAKEAADLYMAAARDPGIEGACGAAARAARLEGDAARDASITYADLYRADRRFATKAPACVKEIDRAMDSLSPFRPPQRVLEAIDQGLAGEGIGAPGSSASASTNSSAGSPPRVVRVEEYPGQDAARIVVVLDRPAHFRVGDEAGATGEAAHTFVDLDGVDVGSVAKAYASSGVVTRVRAEATTSGARVVLDLDGRAFRRVFYLPEPYRVVIDIARQPPGAALGHARRTVARVVLDPGHGGYDPGAIGPGGLREKDVTLDIAHRVAPVLARDGLQVVLTRDDDRFVSLEERTARANGFEADLFVSIHCNASENGKGHGVETYVLDTTRDDISDRVAARENATTEAANAELGRILATMRMADQSTRSTKLAELMQRSALASLRVRYPDVKDGGVHTAGFYVLVGARMPSILFETSYISWPDEEARLSTDDYKQRLADAIVNALKAYREGR